MPSTSSRHGSTASPLSSSSIRLLLAVLALSLPALATAASAQQQHQHGPYNALQQRHSPHLIHAKRAPLAVAIDDAYGGQDYHRMRLMPRQSSVAAGNGQQGGQGSSDGDGDGTDTGTGNSNDTPLASGRGSAGVSPSAGPSASAGNNNNGNGNGASASVTNGNAGNSASVPAASASEDSASSDSGGLLGGLGSGISSALNGGSSTSDVASVTSSSTDPALQSPSVDPNATPTDSAIVDTGAVTSDPAAASSASLEVEDTTITQTVAAPTTEESAPAAEDTAAAAKEKEESSGIPKSAIIIVIVVASCVGAAIAIWTIIRKVKLSPSSRFNRRIAPVDFSANRRDSDYFGALGSVDNLSGGGHSPPNGMISDKDGMMNDNAWPLHHSPSQSSHGHGRQESNEKMGGIYGAIAPALPPSSSAGSLRRNPTMMSSATGMTGSAGAGLNRADSMASSARGHGGMSDSGHGANAQQQQYQGFYPGLPPSLPSQPQLAQVYNPAPNNYPDHEYAGYNAGAHQQYQYQQQSYAPQYYGGLDYSNSMRRPGGNGGYEY